MTLNADLKAELFQLGFSAAGITTLQPPAHIQTYRAWIENGSHAEMAYLASEPAMQRRADPRLIAPEASALVVVALPYPNPGTAPGPASSAPHGRVASYAWGADYHDLIPPRLNQAAHALEIRLGHPIATRAYTDTGPILERDMAQAAGLGWIGKHSCLILPGKGSFFLLGVLFIQAELEPDPPFADDHCGSCSRCIEACPTGCIQNNRTLDARRCISYLTIENKGQIPPDLRSSLGDWVFGCDICQQVCPWNLRFAHSPATLDLQPRPQNARPDLLHELALTQEAFSQKFRGSSVKRAKRRGYLRNIAVALGNSADPSAAPALVTCLQNEPEALVRRHAAWALGRLRTPLARSVLSQTRGSEPDPDVQAEIQSALAGLSEA
jgi:epoxyqueuosine reductase